MGKDPVFPAPGAIFDPKTIAVLTVAYDKAIEGQSASVREVIANLIIELACEGERGIAGPSRRPRSLPRRAVARRREACHGRSTLRRAVPMHWGLSPVEHG